MRTRPLRRFPTSSTATLASSPPRSVLRGIAAAPGRVVAPVWRWSTENHEPAPSGLSGAQGVEQLRRAIEQVRADLAATTTRLQAAGLTAESGILEAQALMLDDPALVDGASELMAQGRPADESVATALAPFADMLRASPDPVFQARAADVEDVVGQLRRALHGAGGMPPAPLQPSIVVARDLAPSQTAGLDRALVLRFATEPGSATAHTAILARALGLPAVVGIPGLLEAVEGGQVVLLDGDDGTLLVDPPAEAVASVRPSAQAAAGAEPAGAAGRPPAG